MINSRCFGLDYIRLILTSSYILLGHATHNRFLAQITRLIKHNASVQMPWRGDGHIKSHYQLFKAVKEGPER